MSEAQYNPNDLANGYYPHLRKVSLDDPEWTDILRWFRKYGIPQHARLVAPKGIAAPGLNPIMPTVIQWTRNDAVADGTQDVGDVKTLDAALVFNFPHVALVELMEFYNLPKPATAIMYPGFRKPLVVVQGNPIGEPWPTHGPNAYRPSLDDDFDYGARVTTPDGTFVKERKGWAFVSFPVWFKVA